MKKKWLLVAGFSLVGSVTAAENVLAPFSVGRASFAVRYRGEESSYKVNAVFVHPGEKLVLEVIEVDATLSVEAATGSLKETSPQKWTWQAPSAAGLYPITFRDASSGDQILLNVFVTVPHDALRKEHLNGYRIGRYPSTPLKNLPIYRPPAGFVEVTRENETTYLSPHFQLRQFVCKQEGGYPKYLVLRERLLLKLELLLELVNRKGIRADTLHVMSGYRTPSYNSAIRNVRYSRHVYGGAVDIFVDENPKDGTMDDLNGDGRIDDGDTRLLEALVEELEKPPVYTRFIGGLARYESNAVHGPFLHLDVRGTKARWGRGGR